MGIVASPLGLVFTAALLAVGCDQGYTSLGNDAALLIDNLGMEGDGILRLELPATKDTQDAEAYRQEQILQGSNHLRHGWQK